MDQFDLKYAIIARLCRPRMLQLYIGLLCVVVVMLFLNRPSPSPDPNCPDCEALAHQRKVPRSNKELFPPVKDFVKKNDFAREKGRLWEDARVRARDAEADPERLQDHPVPEQQAFARGRRNNQEAQNPDKRNPPQENPNNAMPADSVSTHGYLVYDEHESIFSRIRWPEGTRLSGSEPKVIDWYNAPTWLKRRGHDSLFSGCPIQSCTVRYDGKLRHRADALLISSTDIPSAEPPPRRPGQMWVLVTMEAPTKQGHFYKTPKWVGVFNWTMTYRRDSDVWLPYGFLRRKTSPSPRNFTHILRQKSRSVSWLVSNMHAHNRRHEYVAMLKKFIPVDMYGRCHDLCRRWNGSGEEWNDYLTQNYHFYLSFENNNCRDYTSEKFLKTFTSDVVPVVRGGPWFEYDKFFPKGTFVDTKNFRTVKELADHLRFLEQNPQEYVDILQRRSHYVLGNHADFVAAAMCQMCVKLHNLDKFSKTYPNMKEWMLNGVCLNDVKDIVMQ